MTTALEGGEWSAARPGRSLPPGKTRYPLYRRLGGLQGRSGRAENLAPPGFDPRTVQPVPQSLYRLSYRAHTSFNTRLKLREKCNTFSWYQITRRHFPEDRILHSHRSESFRFKNVTNYCHREKLQSAYSRFELGFNDTLAAFLYKPEAWCCLYCCLDVALGGVWQQPVQALGTVRPLY
jgi:hypothetical protein